MTIAVWGNESAFEELNTGQPGIEWLRPETWDAFLDSGAQVLFNLEEPKTGRDYAKVTAPLFIHSVTATSKQAKLPPTAIRINGWPGFLKRAHWEYAGTMTESHREALNALAKQYTQVPDEPGFIAARIIAMIINEAYYAKGEQVSSEADIDIAMKLGTNYPLGPFEWARLIGLKKIHALLSELSSIDPRYTPSPALSQEAANA